MRGILRRVHEISGYPSGWPDDPKRWLTPAGQVAARVAEDDTATWVTPAGISPRLRCYLGPKEPSGP